MCNFPGKNAGEMNLSYTPPSSIYVTLRHTSTLGVYPHSLRTAGRFQPHGYNLYPRLHGGLHRTLVAPGPPFAPPHGGYPSPPRHRAPLPSTCLHTLPSSTRATCPYYLHHFPSSLVSLTTPSPASLLHPTAAPLPTGGAAALIHLFPRGFAPVLPRHGALGLFYPNVPLVGGGGGHYQLSSPRPPPSPLLRGLAPILPTIGSPGPATPIYPWGTLSPPFPSFHFYPPPIKPSANLLRHNHILSILSTPGASYYISPSTPVTRPSPHLHFSQLTLFLLLGAGL